MPTTGIIIIWFEIFVKNFKAIVTAEKEVKKERKKGIEKAAMVCYDVDVFPYGDYFMHSVRLQTAILT